MTYRVQPTAQAEADIDRIFDGIDETEWRDDPESLADWEAWLKTIEPFESTPDEAKRSADFDSIGKPGAFARQQRKGFLSHG